VQCVLHKLSKLRDCRTWLRELPPGKIHQLNDTKIQTKAKQKAKLKREQSSESGVPEN
jgi:hypothetical protein